MIHISLPLTLDIETFFVQHESFTEKKQLEPYLLLLDSAALYLISMCGLRIDSDSFVVKFFIADRL